MSRNLDSMIFPWAFSEAYFSQIKENIKKKIAIEYVHEYIILPDDVP